MEHFFPRFQVEICAQMHTRVKLLEGMLMKTILKLLGAIQLNYWGGYIPPSPPDFGTLDQHSSVHLLYCEMDMTALS